MANQIDITFSHFGIFVTDLEKMREFYLRHLGFVETDRGEVGGRSLSFLSRNPDEHHQMVLVQGRPQDNHFNVVNQISFRLGGLGDLKTAYGNMKDTGVEDLVSITHGNALSIYFRDPEGNRVELFVDMPWHVTQPIREPLDLDQSEEDIMAQTEEFCGSLPGFQPRSEWRADMVRKLEGA